MIDARPPTDPPMPALPDLDDRIADAYLYAFAVQDLARTRWNATRDAANPNRFDANTLSHARRLLGPRDRWITMPNNDTLYTIAWLDLSAGPVRVTYPAMDARYFSFAFLDPWTDNAALVSRRTHGGGARTLWLAPPGWTGEPPAGDTPLRMDANDVWMLGRVLVDGEADVPPVRRGPGRRCPTSATRTPSSRSRTKPSAATPCPGATLRCSRAARRWGSCPASPTPGRGSTTRPARRGSG
jgi:hypothetical protein